MHREGVNRRSILLAGPAVAAASTGFAAESDYPNLFKPYELAGLKLKNRIVHAAMSTRYTDNGRALDAFIHYHAARAQGGCAMIVSEPLGMIARQTGGRRIDVYTETIGDDVKRWVEAVEGQDCRLLGQLQDSGRGRNEPGRNMDAIGASALPDDLSWTMPHALETGEVERLIAEFVRSCRNLQRVGFSGIEISAGHGHLFHQFMSAQSNKRTDKFGGDLEGRTRFLTDLMTAIRSTCGPKFIIGAKLPGEDEVPGGIGMSEARDITALVHRTGAASYITYCWGAHAETLFLHLPDHNFPPAPYVGKIEQLAKAAPGVATAALGFITKPEQAEAILAAKSADLVMLGRPLVADPAWPKKARESRRDQIRLCVSCNTCWAVINTGAGIRCDANPRLATPGETDWTPKAAAKKRRIVVVGGGLAGMEAAWVAAARGHEVTLFSTSTETGGKARLHARLPGGRGVENIFMYQRGAVQRHGVRLEMGRAATVETVMALKPDAVVLAGGAHMLRPSHVPAETQDLRSVARSALDEPAKKSGTAVIYDQDHTAMTYAATLLLADRYERVVLVTPRERLATDEPVVNRQGIYRRLSRRGVEIVTSSDLSPKSSFARGQVVLANVYSGVERRIEGVTQFTYATSRAPNDALATPLREQGIEVHVVGDCLAGRTVLTAVGEGHKAGNAV